MSILSGDLCKSWQEFGRLADQLSFFIAALCLGVGENADFAIFYDHELRMRAQRLARKRDVMAIMLISRAGEMKKRKDILRRAYPSEVLPSALPHYAHGRKKSP